MTIEALDAELKSLQDFRNWLVSKLTDVEIDIEMNEVERADILADMERLKILNEMEKKYEI